MVEFPFSDAFTNLLVSKQVLATISVHRGQCMISSPIGVTHTIQWNGREYCHGTFERMGPASFQFISSDLSLVEKCVISIVSSEFRQFLGHSRIDTYSMARRIKYGFEAYMLEDHYSTLRDMRTGQVYPMRVFEVLGIPLRATRLSYIVTVSVEELFASYMDPNGAPLFSDFIRVRPVK